MEAGVKEQNAILLIYLLGLGIAKSVTPEIDMSPINFIPSLMFHCCIFHFLDALSNSHRNGS